MRGRQTTGSRLRGKGGPYSRQLAGSDYRQRMVGRVARVRSLRASHQKTNGRALELTRA
jgi:hypothetical protein